MSGKLWIMYEGTEVLDSIGNPNGIHAIGRVHMSNHPQVSILKLGRKANATH